MNPIAWLLSTILHLYFLVVVAQVIFSWLVNFNILNRYQPFVQQLGVVFEQLTAPAYKFIRKYIPPIAGIDLSPLVLIIGIQFAQRVIIWALG